MNNLWIIGGCFCAGGLLLMIFRRQLIKLFNKATKKGDTLFKDGHEELIWNDKKAPMWIMVFGGFLLATGIIMLAAKIWDDVYGGITTEPSTYTGKIKIPPSSLPIPNDATSIKYEGVKHPGIGFEEYLKFQVPADKSIAAGKDLLKSHSKQLELISEDIQDYDLSVLKGPEWFCKNKIAKGKRLYLKGSGPGGPVVLADTGTGYVYWLLTD